MPKTLELYLVEWEGYATYLVRATGPAAARAFVEAREELRADRNTDWPERPALKVWHCVDDGAPGVLMTSVDTDGDNSTS